MKAARNPRSGQAMLETLLVMLVACLLFFGLFQTALVFQADEVLHHSAARAARARSVGFNEWMVTKAQRVAAIPNSGRMIEPAVDVSVPFLDPDAPPGELWDRAIDRSRANARSARAVLERVRIPEYLDTDNRLRGEAILDYEEWQNHSFDVSATRSNPLAAALGAAGTIRASVRQRYPLNLPLAGLVYPVAPDADGVIRVSLAGESEILDHASLYLVE